MVLIAIAWLACITAAIETRTLKDPDIWWHLATGDWIFRNGHLPRMEPFSWTTAGQSYIAYTWLFDLAAAWVSHSLGLFGIFLAVLTLLLCIAVLLSMLIYARSGGLIQSLTLAVTALIAMAPLATPRPWLLSILFFLILLWLLLRAGENGRIAWLVPLPVLFVLWANIHIQFVYGLLLLGLFALESTASTFFSGRCGLHSKIDPRIAWGALATGVAATLVNPNGWRLWQVVYFYITQKAAVNYVQEMQAFSFRHLTDWLALVLALAAMFAIGRRLAECQPLIVSIFVCSCWFAFRSVRDVWMLVIPASLLIADAWKSKKLFLSRSMRCLAVALTIILVFLVIRVRRISERSLQNEVNEAFPNAAAQFIESRKLAGPLYNSYDWGGYLIWRLHDLPVSIDGRANIYGDTLLERTIQTWRGNRSWQSDPALSKSNLILAEADSPLCSLLKLDLRFQLIYHDKIAAVFIRH
jgi:hypothetical protein